MIGIDRNYLDAGFGSEFSPRVPVVLIEGIFDGNDGKFFDELLVEIGQLLVFDESGGVWRGILEVQVVFAFPTIVSNKFISILLRSNFYLPEKFRGGDIHADINLASVTGLLNGSRDQVQGYNVNN